MNDAPTKERPWWDRIHLSTCILLMFAAGALAWANLNPKPCLRSYEPSGKTRDFGVGVSLPSNVQITAYVEKYGWPWTACEDTWAYAPGDRLLAKPTSEGQGLRKPNRTYNSSASILLGNVLPALCILAWVTVASEYYIHLRQRAIKPQDPDL